MSHPARHLQADSDQHADMREAEDTVCNPYKFHKCFHTLGFAVMLA